MHMQACDHTRHAGIEKRHGMTCATFPCTAHPGRCRPFCGEQSATKHHASQRLLRRHLSCARKKPCASLRVGRKRWDPRSGCAMHMQACDHTRHAGIEKRHGMTCATFPCTAHPGRCRPFCGEQSATKHHASQRLLRRHLSCARKKPCASQIDPKGSHEGGAGGPRLLRSSRGRKTTALEFKDMSTLRPLAVPAHWRARSGRSCG